MNTPDTPEQNDSMSLLERRLAEIAARRQQQQDPAASPSTPAPAAATTTPAPAPAGDPPTTPPAGTTPTDTVAPTELEAPSQPTAALVTEAGSEGMSTPTTEAAPEPKAEMPPGEATEAEATQPAADMAPDVPSSSSAIAEGNETTTEPAMAQPVAETEPATETVPEPETSSMPAAEMPVMPEMPAAAPPDADAEPAQAPVMEPVAAEAPAAETMSASTETAESAKETDASDSAEEDEAEDTTDAPVEFDNFDALDAGQMSRLLLAAIQRPEAADQAKSLIDRKRQYEARYDQEREEALKRFVAAGGEPAEFDRSDTPEHRALERGWQQFREQRAQRRRQEEQQQQQNLERKRVLLQQLRELADPANTNTEAVAPKVKALQVEWRAVGPVPYKESRELWQTYDALLDRFYSQHNVTFELKDLDRRKNLELKNALVARAEALSALAENNPGQAARELRGLHEEWKHLGPVPQELREEVWGRFMAASDRIHGRRSEELAGRRATEQEALERKQGLMSQLEVLAEFSSDRIEDWKTKTDELQNLKQQWDAAGYAPRAQAQELNKRFWTLYKKFFQNKGTFFKALDDERASNVKRKEELIALAEQHQDDPDYGATREKYIQWQKEWKNIGPVPERLSQKLWNRFRTACNAFFERPNREIEQRQAAQAAREAQLDQLSGEKNAYLDQLAERLSQPETNAAGSLDEYHSLLASWAQFDADRGAERVPVSPRVEERFFTLLGKYLDTVPDLTYAQKQDLLFRQHLEQMKAAPDAAQRFARREQELRHTVNQLENDISTLRTNLGFFARSKNADTLRQEYEGRIQEAESRLEHAKQQLKTLRSVAPPLPLRESRGFGSGDRDDRRGGGRPGGDRGGRPGGGGFGGPRR